MVSGLRGGSLFPRERKRVAYLLNGHHDLNGVQAVETEVVGEVGNAGDLVAIGVLVYVWLPDVPGFSS
jgi:hypothetical protein